MEQKPASPDHSLKRGKLRIGNDWNAITIIALSQSNPLKAIAELVENSIDARATSISIIRGRSEGNYYLEIRDNGARDYREHMQHFWKLSLLWRQTWQRYSKLSVEPKKSMQVASSCRRSSGRFARLFWHFQRKNTIGLIFTPVLIEHQGSLRNIGITERLIVGVTERENGNGKQRQFFEFAGPLFTVTISPASSVVRVGEQRTLRALPYDRSRRRVETDLTFAWEIVEGGGALEDRHDQVATFIAPAEPGLARIKVIVSQNDIERSAEALITVTRELLSQVGTTVVESQGLPGYTFESAPGESWRSRYDTNRNVIVINNGHRDFVYVARTKTLKLRYLIRLYAKELVPKNFVGLPPDQLLERMVELSLRTEENL
jgi:hypothetical protein